MINSGQGWLSSIKKKNIKIINGRGDLFWITALNSSDKRISDIPNLDCFGMSMDDFCAAEFLAEFLYKYFDPSIQKREEYEPPEFDWYDANLFTFDSVRRMLSDIKQTVAMLQEDHNNPSLAQIKENWTLHRFTDKAKFELTAEELNEVEKRMVLIAVDFYERFCSRMENMLKIPENDIVTFTGP